MVYLYNKDGFAYRFKSEDAIYDFIKESPQLNHLLHEMIRFYRTYKYVLFLFYEEVDGGRIDFCISTNPNNPSELKIMLLPMAQRTE